MAGPAGKKSIADREGRRGLLSTRAFWIYSVWQLAGILGILFPPLMTLWLISIPLFVMVLYFDRQTLLPSDRLALTVTLDVVPEVGKPVVVRAAILSTGPGASRLFRPQVLAPRSEVIEFPNPRSAAGLEHTREGHSLVSHFTAAAVRVGYEEWRLLGIEYSSLLGLWTRRAQVSIDPLAVRVTPSRSRMREEEFRALQTRQRLLFQGNRLRARAQSRDQFHSIREYQYPDPIRDIDQRKSAKYERPMVRVYEAVQQHHLVLALDLGRGMYGEIGRSRKSDFYLSACAALARHAIESQDQVSFIAFSQAQHFHISRARSLEAFGRLFRGDVMFRPREEESNYDILFPLVSRVASQRSIVLILSDVSRPSTQEQLIRSLGPLSLKHFTVVMGLLDKNYDLLSQVLSYPQGETENAAREELYWRLSYAYKLEEEFRRFSARVADRGAMALQISEEHWLDAATRVYGLMRQSMHA